MLYCQMVSKPTGDQFTRCRAEAKALSKTGDEATILPGKLQETADCFGMFT